MSKSSPSSCFFGLVESGAHVFIEIRVAKMYVIASASRAHASSSMWVLNSAPPAADKAFQYVMKALTPAVGSTVRPGDADQGKLLRERFAARKIIKRRYHQTLRQIAGGAPKMASAQGSAGLATPTMPPYLPITPDQIAAEAIAAAEAGAAILHLRARDPETGKPDQSPETFARFLPRIKQGTTAAINITTGGSPYMRVEERVLPAATFKPEVASLNMGSMNLGLYHLLPKYKEFKFDWEKAEATRDLVFRNNYKDIELLATCYGNGTRFEFECYDIAVALATDAGRINGS